MKIYALEYYIQWIEDLNEIAKENPQEAVRLINIIKGKIMEAEALADIKIREIQDAA